MRTHKTTMTDAPVTDVVALGVNEHRVSLYLVPPLSGSYRVTIGRPCTTTNFDFFISSAMQMVVLHRETFGELITGAVHIDTTSNIDIATIEVVER